MPPYPVSREHFFSLTPKTALGGLGDLLKVTQAVSKAGIPTHLSHNHSALLPVLLHLGQAASLLKQERAGHPSQSGVLGWLLPLSVATPTHPPLWGQLALVPSCGMEQSQKL